MGAVLFAPHNDDETLFAFYQCLRLKPYVVVCRRSFRQWVEQKGPAYSVREDETQKAMEIAGCSWEQWPWPDNEPNWNEIAEAMQEIVDRRMPSTLIYPAWELGGHEDHNAVSSIAHGLAGDGFKRVVYYTYQRGHGRTREGTMVEGTLEEEDLKLKALLCYASQIKHLPTTDWFPSGTYHDMREWIA